MDLPQLKFSEFKQKWNSINFTYPVLILLIYIFLVAFMPESGLIGDNLCWRRWCGYILKDGLGNLYHSYIDYLPLYPYILFIFTKIQGTTEAIAGNIHYLKAFTLIFDFAGAFLAVYFVPKTERKWLLPFFILFNPAYLYNTYIWNQVDAIYATMGLASLVMALRQRVTWSMFFFILAINTKLQSIIFLPPLMLIWLSEIRSGFSWKGLGRGLALITLTQLLILAPYDVVAMYYKVIVTAVGRYPIVSMNAFNFWHLVSNEHLISLRDDSLWYAGLSYRQWGYLLFLASSFFILLPLLQSAWQQFKGKTKTISPDLVFLTMGLIALSFFFFLTQMHERYCHPALILFYAYGLIKQKYSLIILFSIAYILNLEKIMQYFELKNYITMIFDQKFIAGIFALTLVIGVSQLYRNYFLGKVSN